MKSSIRGMECSLYNSALKIDELLIFLSQEPCSFYIPWCSMIYRQGMLFPEGFQNFTVSSKKLRNLAKQSIWELVLHMYHPGSDPEIIETYEDFANGVCTCCLIYYDCGLLEVYVKEYELFQKVWHMLTCMGVKDLTVITDTNYRRTAMHL